MTELNDTTVYYGKWAFDAYNKDAGGKTWDGKDIPKWDDLNDAVRSHWIAVGSLIVNLLSGVKAT